MVETSVGGIVLAAGSSTRMGRNKLLLPLDGESLVRGAARRALAGGPSPVVVVLGKDAERMASEIEGLSCVATVNPRSESGLTSSGGR